MSFFRCLFTVQLAGKTSSEGLKPGVDVTIEVRGEEIVISKPRIECSYTDYYASTSSPKLKERVDVKKIITEQVAHRHAPH
jgi:hypothetical protein